MDKQKAIEVLREQAAFYRGERNQAQADGLVAQAVVAASDMLSDLSEQLDAHRAADESRRRLVREIDVMLNGEEGAAKQASLCDLVGQIGRMVAGPRAISDADLCDIFKRRVKVEQALFDMANGKRGQPTQQELRELALLLGAPSVPGNPATCQHSAVRAEQRGSQRFLICVACGGEREVGGICAEYDAAVQAPPKGPC